MDKNPIRYVGGYVGFFLVVVGLLMLGSIFLQNDALDSLSGSILMNIMGCVCGIVGWKNPFGKVAVCLGAIMAAFFAFTLIMAVSATAIRF